MSERIRSVAIAAALVVMAAVLAVLVLTTESPENRVESLGERIKCPVCQGESIGNSPSQMARDMMALVTERVEEGRTDQEIVDELLNSYSGAVLLDPPAEGATLILWLAPAIALIVGAGVIYWWRKNPGDERDQNESRAKPRRLAPLLVLGVAFVGIVVTAGFFLQDRQGTATGVADIGDQDLTEVSNETMEAVIAENADHPLVDGMRLALAERYFNEGDFRSAFTHYLAVAESTNANQDQVVTSLVRLGWMAWVGNSEVDAAIGLFDEALGIAPQSTTAMYLKGQVLWCGAGNTGAAEDLFLAVLDDPDLSGSARTDVAADLDALRSGASCA